MDYLREEVVERAQRWVGKKESDGSFFEIIEIYNKNVAKTPRKIKMESTWPWCAAFWSSVAFSLGYEPVMPVEMSCSELIKIAKKLGIWVEDDGYVPLPGDAVLYDWSDDGKGDCVGPPDHIGVVEYVNKNAGYFTVIEGNYSDSVKKRTVLINGIHIRGFITPKYTYKKYSIEYKKSGKTFDVVAHEVISGIWGNGEERVKNLKEYGYNPTKVQNRVNEILSKDAVQPSTPKEDAIRPTEKKVTAGAKAQKYAKSVTGTYQTTANVYLRTDSGTNKKALCLIPKGTKVQCYGYFNNVYTNKTWVRWLYIQVPINGTLYTGFTCGKYLKKV